MNPLADKALKARQDAANLTQEAINALLAEQRAISEQLKALGYVEGQKPPKVKEAKPVDPNKKCGTCGATDHDGRFHRRKSSNTVPPETSKPPQPPPSKPPAPQPK